MDWKRTVGKLLLMGAGMGGLVVLIFVLLPWLTQPPVPPQEMASEEIVTQVMDSGMAEDADSGDSTGVAEESVDSAVQGPATLVGVRNNGDEVPVVFTVVDGESSDGVSESGGPVEDTGKDRDSQVREEQPEAPVGADASLPPVLSAEEVATAMDGLGAENKATETAVAVDAPEPRVEETDERDGEAALTGGVDPVTEEDVARWLSEAGLLDKGAVGGHGEAMLPPLAATRDVQELLEALGYAPGPVDGIWGERTEEAWRQFAGDAAGLVERSELAVAGPELGEAVLAAAETEPGLGQAVPAAVETESAGELSDSERPTPSGAPDAAEGPGAVRAGGPDPAAGLPAKEGLPVQEADRPVVVPGTLRGVMGYRMPLVSRQGVPDQIVSGVLIPAHTTFVILKPGHWELIGLEPGEVERLRNSTMPEPKADVEPERRRWNPLRIFRKRAAPETEGQ